MPDLDSRAARLRARFDSPAPGALEPPRALDGTPATRLARRAVTVAEAPLSPVARLLLGGGMVGMSAFVASRVLGDGGVAAVPPKPMFALAATLLLGFVGVTLLVGAWRVHAQRRDRVARQLRHPHEPWLADHPWDAEGGRDIAADEIHGSLGFTAACACFAVPMTRAAFFAAARIPPLAFIAVVMDLMLAIGAWQVVRHLRRRVRYGRGRVELPAAPWAPGDEVDVPLEGLGARARALPLVATLRCIEERWETRGTGRTRSTALERYALWEARQSLPPGADRVRFRLPDEAPACALAERPGRCWELELAGERERDDYLARFLLPVYPRAAARRVRF